MSAGAFSGGDVTLVVAVAENGAIGRAGDLPWRQSSDLRRFREWTLGKPLVMGRKTFDSIGRPLDGRDNIVITSRELDVPGAIRARSMREALEEGTRRAAARGAREIMVIGGAAIFAEALPFATRILWTEIHAAPEGDVFFPAFDRSEWREVSRTRVAAGPKDDHDMSFVNLARNKPD
jgi:dihydrofolate reductase